MTAPTAPPPLAVPADYTKYIGAVPAGLDIVSMLAAASDEIRRVARWHIAPVITETVTLDGPGGGGLLMVQTLNLVAVTAVSNGGVAVDPTTFEWSSNGYLRWATADVNPSWTDRTWTSKFRGITVTIQHGLTPVPDGLVKLACSVAARSAVAPSGILRKAIGSTSVQYSVGLFADEVAYAATFRIPGRP